jgi:hypothetical protein
LRSSGKAAFPERDRKLLGLLSQTAYAAILKTFQKKSMTAV